MKANYLIQTCVWTLLVLGGLLLMRFFPPLAIGHHALRRVDLLGDVRFPAPSAASDTIGDTIPPPPQVVFLDTCLTGMTCIEDYSDSTRRGMAPFYEALREHTRFPRPVRIAVFGDSFIEADILTADLRNLLQSAYGGRGVGYVDVASPNYGWRPTVRQSFDGWQSHAVTDSVHFDRSREGISERYFIAQPGAYVELRGQTQYGTRLDSADRAAIYFRAEEEVSLTATVNRRFSREQRFLPGGNLQRMEVNGPVGTVRWVIDQATAATTFYGVTMDDTEGISLDNFALRSTTGLSLRSIPESFLKEFNAFRPYDLVILLFGLNVATEHGHNYDKYTRGMQRTIDHLKTCFPDAGLLVVGVGDRDYRTPEGELHTMP
ncbi:MAG: hypothetical protein LBL78_01270, partial [Prevotellaceae bacterium]|nr:hypothetical protein [Prevotellaceae bacterium]